MKKILLALVLLVLLGAGGAYLALRSGVGGADDWVVRRLVRISETYIAPKIDFKDFEWDGSRTITLRDVTLTSDDGTEVVRAASMTVVTERVPVNGGAFIIESIDLDDPTLRLIQTTDSDGAIGFKGLVPFVKTQNIANQDAVDKDVKLSDTFKIRQINMRNGGFEYHAGDGSDPMLLRKINLEINLTPEDSGAYLLDADLSREGVFDMPIKGELDLDAMQMRGMDIAFNADLTSQEAVQALPPQIQSLLREYEVRGRLESTITGDVMLSDPIGSSLEARVRMNDAHFAAGEYDFPVSSMQLDASVGEGVAMVEMNMSTSSGTVSLDRLRSDLRATGMPTTFAMSASNVDIQEFLRYQPPENEPPKFAGILGLTLSDVRFNLADMGEAMAGTLANNRISGNGSVKLRNGRLVSIPIISDLVDAMDIVAALTGTQTMKDKADLAFTLDGKGLVFDDDDGIDVETQVASVRGDGRINYDQTLRLSVNGGPVEKLQDQLGGIGDILGAVTDGLVKYVVEGTFGDPRVSVKPLGIGG